MGDLDVSLSHLEGMGEGTKSKVDLIVKVGDFHFPVHSLLLSRKSPLLEETFDIALDPSNKDSAEKVVVEGFVGNSPLPLVTFDDAAPITLERFKQLLMIEYSTFELPDLTLEEYKDLAIVADWLRNDTLTAWCDKKIAGTLGFSWDKPVHFAPKEGSDESWVGVDAELLIHGFKYQLPKTMAGAAGSLLRRVCLPTQFKGAPNRDDGAAIVDFFRRLPPAVASVVIGEMVPCVMYGQQGIITIRVLTFKFQEMFRKSK